MKKITTSTLEILKAFHQDRELGLDWKTLRDEGRSKLSFVEWLQQSPWHGVELDIQRDKMLTQLEGVIKPDQSES